MEVVLMGRMSTQVWHWKTFLVLCAGMENMVLAHQQAHQLDSRAGTWLGRGQGRTVL